MNHNNIVKYFFYITLYTITPWQNIVSSPVSVADGGTGLNACQAYAILCAGTTDTNPLQVVTDLGTSGYFLTSNGASALPTFQSKTGELVLISQTTTSATSLTLNSSTITSTYSNYFIIFLVDANWSANGKLLLDMSTNNGSTFLNSNYQTGVKYHAYNTATITNQSSTTTGYIAADTNGSGARLFKWGYIYLYGLRQSASTGPFYFGSFASINITNSAGYCYGINTGSSNVNCIKFTVQHTGGTPTIFVSIYGIKE